MSRPTRHIADAENSLRAAELAHREHPRADPVEYHLRRAEIRALLAIAAAVTDGIRR